MIADAIVFSNVDGPGNRFVVFMQGCNFDCVACHNPQTIPGHEPLDGFGPRRRTIADLMAEIGRAAPFIRGVTISGGEATQQAPFVKALFESIKADRRLAHLTCMIDTNGACPTSTWDELAPLLDGAMVDLKCIDDTIHRQMTGQSNREVLASIEHLHRLGLLYEVRLLLIAGVNDDPGLLATTARWLADVDPTMRLKVIGFHLHGSRPQQPPLVEPTLAQLERAVQVFTEISPFDVSMVSSHLLDPTPS